MNKEKIAQVFEHLSEDNPEPVTELEAPNPFCLLVAIVLSAQATDVGVNKATKDLFKKADTPEKILALGEGGLKEHIKTIGLFNSKAKNVIALCQRLLSTFDGEIPHNREDLQTLPGVGRKTANVWLNCVLGHETIAVDTHVYRVSNRIGITKAKNVLESEKQLDRRIPKPWKRHAHHWLILHGRYVCKARKPLCEKCKIVDLCEYKAKTV
ncbi:MAG: endonuclease III [Rickettsiales bacterium]|nr:endonuclease III [Rickettsiales bacterium]